MAKKIHTSSWRKMTIAIYKPPSDGKVYGSYEIDATEMLKFIAKKKEEGVRITVTNIVTAAFARVLYFDSPEINCFVRRGKLIQRDSVDVFLAVDGKEKNVTGMIIRNAESMTVSDVAAYQEKKLSGIGSDKKPSFGIIRPIGKVPWPLRGLVVRFIKWWGIDNGFKIPFVKLGKNPLGSVSISNIGTFGLNTGFLALFPIANYPAAISIGMIKDKPVVIDGEIVIRPMLPVCGTFDHRIMDGGMIGKITRSAERRLMNPECLDLLEQPKKEM